MQNALLCIRTPKKVDIEGLFVDVSFEEDSEHCSAYDLVEFADNRIASERNVEILMAEGAKLKAEKGNSKCFKCSSCLHS